MLTRAITPASFREEDRSTEFILSTDSKVRIYDWDLGMIDEILLGNGVELPANRQVPLLDCHNRFETNNLLGSVRDFKTEENKLIGRAYFGKRQKAVDAFSDVKDGHLTDISVGYRNVEAVWIPEGSKMNVLGREYAGPVRVVTKWQIKEASLVPIGANPEAKARNEPVTDGRQTAVIPNHEVSKMPGTVSTNGETPVTTRNAPTVGEPTSAINVKDIEDKARREATEAERTRILDIRRACSLPGTEHLAEDLIARGATPDDARKTVIEHMRSNVKPISAPSVNLVADERDKFRAAATDGLLIRGNVGGMIEKPSEGAKSLAKLGFEGLAREALRLVGVDCSRLSKEEIFRRAFAANVSSDFPLILEATANKAVMAGFNYAAQTYKAWAKTGNLPNFLAHKRVGLGSAPELLKVAEGGEIKYGSLTEYGEALQLMTLARKLGISRQALVNDTVGIFEDVFAAFGARASAQVNALPYSVLTNNPAMNDGVALFHANHGNLVASGTVLNETNLALAIAAMMAHTAPAATGETKIKLNVTPKVLLVGPANAFKAQLLTASAALPTSGMSSAVINPFAGLQLVVDANITGYTWYLVADKIGNAAVEVLFLDGNEAPTLIEVESTDILGKTYVAYIDVGSGPVDYRNIYKNPGAAS